MGYGELLRALEEEVREQARVLLIANSAFYGVPRRIGTVTEAVVLLVTNMVRALAIAAATTQR